MLCAYNFDQNFIIWFLNYCIYYFLAVSKYLPNYKYGCRSTISRSRTVSSSQFLLDFSEYLLKASYVSVLAVFNNKLLIGCESCDLLFVYSHEGRFLSTIKLNNDEVNLLNDATWTPRGNIVYTTLNTNKVVVMSESGKINSVYTRLTTPRYISVSNENIIYLADEETGLYQSTDDAISWNLVFKPADGWRCLQATKVTADRVVDFWTLGRDNNDTVLYRRVYSVDSSNGLMTWKNINLTTQNGKDINFPYNSVSYDGNMNFFILDVAKKVVHSFSPKGQHYCQLLSLPNFKNFPSKLAVDKERLLLYVGQMGGVVGVFKLTYGNDVIDQMCAVNT